MGEPRVPPLNPSETIVLSASASYATKLLDHRWRDPIKNDTAIDISKGKRRNKRGSHFSHCWRYDSDRGVVWWGTCRAGIVASVGSILFGVVDQSALVRLVSVLFYGLPKTDAFRYILET